MTAQVPPTGAPSPPAPFREVSLNYVAAEDRIRGITNMSVDGPKTGFWLTRRVVLAILQQSGRMLPAASVGGRVSPPAAPTRGEGAAVRKGARDRPEVRSEPIKSVPLTADFLTINVTIRKGVNGQGEPGREVILSGVGGAVSAALSEAEYQAVLDLLALRVHEAGWAASQNAGPQIENLHQLVSLQ